MKFIHLSDLHLGRRLAEFSLLEDQAFILERILEAVQEEKPRAVLLAGDVYDKTVPSAEAVELLDDFLVKLCATGTQVFLSSGNHDSAERLAFGGRLMAASGLHMAPVYNGSVEPFSLEDEYGKVLIYMLPFIKPGHVQRFYPEEKIDSYTDAIRVAISHMPLEEGTRKIILSHQFLTGAERSESEIIPIGGLDNVEASAYDPFDYVALGHLHRPQYVGTGQRIRYCGTPLKYSFSELRDKKSITVVEMDGTGAVSVREIPLTPLRELREIRGCYDELTAKSYYEGTSYRSDYMSIILTDEEDVPEAMSRLRTIYHNLMKLDYDNRRTRYQGDPLALEQKQDLSPLELFEELYKEQNGAPLSEEQKAYLTDMIREVWEEEA